MKKRLAVEQQWVSHPSSRRLPPRSTFTRRTIEIRDSASREDVTGIEVLSPANRERATRGFEGYERKRNEVIRSRTHLVESDLLREGCRHPFSEGFSQREYHVHAPKSDERPNGWVRSIRLSDRLPSIDIPLQTGVASVPLDLRYLIRLAYERAGYDLIVDYSKLPPDFLPIRQAAWANPVLTSNAAVSG